MSSADRKDGNKCGKRSHNNKFPSPEFFESDEPKAKKSKYISSTKTIEASHHGSLKFSRKKKALRSERKKTKKEKRSKQTRHIKRDHYSSSCSDSDSFSSSDSSVNGDSSARTQRKAHKRKKRTKSKKDRSEKKSKLKMSQVKQKQVNETPAKLAYEETLPVPKDTQTHNKSSTVNKRGPMTKEEWERQQSVVRRVYDPDTGRHRLVKGDGEIIEEIVSREQQKSINKQATLGDSISFQQGLRNII